MQMVPRKRGNPLTALAVGVFALAAVAGVLAISDEATAVHFWSGTIRSQPGDAPGLLEVDGYLSFDSSFILWVGGTGLGGTGVDDGVFCDTIEPDQLIGLRLDSPPAWGIITVDGVPIDYELIIREAEGPADPLNPSKHCRFVGQIVAPGTTEPALGAYSTGGGGMVNVVWQKCCRENHPSHVNNNGGGTINAALISKTIRAGGNSAPMVDFEMMAPAPYLSEMGYGNVHCPQDALCTFQVRAIDPDDDDLTYRLSIAAEATNGQDPFIHPPKFSIDKDTGLITWDTNGVSDGDVYSTQIIISDGYNTVPLDFMIEVGPPPPPCWDGSTPVIDPNTGDAICPPPPPPPCPEGMYLSDPADPYSKCIWPPPTPYDPPTEDPILHDPWYVQNPTPGIDKPPALSGGGAYNFLARDGVNWAIAGLDQDADGTPDRLDLCPFDALTTIEDIDGDGIGDGCDADLDGDGILNEADLCQYDAFNSCVKPADGPEASRLAQASNLALGQADAAAARGNAESVHVAQATTESSVAGGAMLGVLAAAVALLLVAMARRSQR